MNFTPIKTHAAEYYSQRADKSYLLVNYEPG